MLNQLIYTFVEKAPNELFESKANTTVLIPNIHVSQQSKFI